MASSSSWGRRRELDPQQPHRHDAGGDAPLGNDSHGVLLTVERDNELEHSSKTHVSRNVISGNRLSGIAIFGSTENVIEGNLIGTDGAGTRPLGNGRGIYLVRDAFANEIGNNPTPGDEPGAQRRVRQHGDGITVTGTGADATRIKGNLIGTTSDGLAPLPNAHNGITVTDELGMGAPGVAQIGGTGDDGNVISGNTRRGIMLAGVSAITVQGNLIGTDATGNAAVANGTEGIELLSTSESHIGGDDAGEGNVISGNTRRGCAAHATRSAAGRDFT